MGVETDYLLSKTEDIDKVVTSLNPSKEFNGVYAKGSDPISLSALHSVISGKENDDVFAIIENFESVGGTDDGEVQVVRVPDEIRESLKEIDQSNIPGIVSRWIETDDYQCCGWQPKIAVAFLAEMREMLNRDGASDKDLVMWISL